MTAKPQTRFARAGEVSIAYQEFGVGPRTIVLCPSFAQHIEMIWEQPVAVEFFERLASMGRVLHFDKRGTGLSDRRMPPSLEERVQDLVAVMDAEGVDRAVVVGTSEGGSLAAFFAATYPQRTQALVLGGAYASWIRQKRDHRDSPSAAYRLATIRALQAFWGTGLFTPLYMAPSMLGKRGFRRWAARYERASMHRADLMRWARINRALDMRAVLPQVQAPTLVIHSSGDRIIPIGSGRFIAQQIPDAQLVEVQSKDHIPWFGAQGAYLGALESFLRRPFASPARTRALATVLFTDIVGSTEMARGMGDGPWVDLLESHDEICRIEVSHQGGRWIKSTGDGMLATFHTPTGGIRCACRLRDRLADELGMEIRAGLHSAEIEIRNEDVGGIAVHQAARVQAVAGPREVVVSGSVRDLVPGSGVELSEFGERELKGLSAPVRLFRVETPAVPASLART